MATTNKPVSAEIEALSAVLGTDASKLLDPSVARAWIALLTAYGRVTRALSSELMDSSGTVPYTPLTLPTNREV